AVIAVIALIIAGKGSSHHAPQDRFAHVYVAGCKPRGGGRTIAINKGDRLHLQVTSDCADEIHVHGYNFKKDVPKDGMAAFNFPATIEGIFVIELESRSEQIASLEVKA